MERNKTVDEYIRRRPEWEPELKLLRQIMQSTGLTETIKWGAPVYTLDGKNVTGIGAFKSYCGLWFFQGVFLKDPHQLLVNAQEGVTKGLRQMRFGSVEEIDEAVIRPYVLEAIENQKMGKEIKAESKPLVVPDELKEALSQSALLSEAFDALTPGKQKEYAGYITEAKRAETKLSRLEKIKPMIVSGVGLHDKYK